VRELVSLHSGKRAGDLGAMTPRAPHTNHPLRRREKRALERRDELIKKYIDEGLTELEAQERAQVEMRDNPKGDWRRG
jgi:membrane carboxypeptidase/penicillin-binding protein